MMLTIAGGIILAIFLLFIGFGIVVVLLLIFAAIVSFPAKVKEAWNKPMREFHRPGPWDL